MPFQQDGRVEETVQRPERPEKVEPNRHLSCSRSVGYIVQLAFASDVCV